MPKWTIATVNWKSIDYLYYQLRMLYEFNPPEDFEFVVYDNMWPNQTAELEELRKSYEHFHNFRIMYWDGKGEQSHGRGLTEILKTADSKYFLSNDPDFFWLKRGHLAFLEAFFDRGFRGVGAEYRETGLPAIWAAAFHTRDIKDLDLTANWYRCPHCNGEPFLIEGQDTGWQTHLRLKNQPHMTFKFRPFQNMDFGSYSYHHGAAIYYHENRDVGVHLFRGDYPPEDPNAELPEEWVFSRRAYGKFFFESSW